MRVSSGSREQGFTLIEVMISILLAMIAVIGVVGLYRVQTRASSNSRHVTEASVLAADKLEQLRTATGVITSSFETGLNELGQPVAGGLFNRTWTVNMAAGFTDIAVNVTWTEEGNPKSSRMIGRRGP